MVRCKNTVYHYFMEKGYLTHDVKFCFFPCFLFNSLFKSILTIIHKLILSELYNNKYSIIYRKKIMKENFSFIHSENDLLFVYLLLDCCEGGFCVLVRQKGM